MVHGEVQKQAKRQSWTPGVELMSAVNQPQVSNC